MRKLAALHELAVRAGKQLLNPDWHNAALQLGREILELDATGLWLLDPERRVLRHTASSGLIDEASVAERVDELAFAGIIEAARQETGLLLDAPAHGISPSVAEATWTWEPIKARGEITGYLSLIRRADGPACDPMLAGALASIIGSWIEGYELRSDAIRAERLYREQVEYSPEAVVLCSLDGRIEQSNVAMVTITGRTDDELEGMSLADCFVDPLNIAWDAWRSQPLETRSESLEFWIAHPSGERRRVSCYARRVLVPVPYSMDRASERIQVVMEDITLSTRRLVELELFGDLTRLIAERGDIEEAYELVSSRLYDYLNYRLVTIGELDDGKANIRAYRNYLDPRSMQLSFDVTIGLCGLAIRENRTILATNVADWPEYLIYDPHVTSEVVALIRVHGEPFGLIDLQTDSSQPLSDYDLQLAERIATRLGLLIEQIRAHETLKEEAFTDPLTRIGNRRALYRTIDELVETSGNQPFSLFLVELDRFKGVNDRFGHLFGDEMLKQITGRLWKMLAPADVMARYGGDEIAIVSRGASHSVALEMAERMRHTISGSPFTSEGQSATLTVSIGIAIYPEHGSTTDELLGEADRAMYAAKREGRDSVALKSARFR